MADADYQRLAPACLCGEPLRKMLNGKHRKACSKRCHSLRWKAINRPPLPARRCVPCGRSFEPAKPDHIYCSRQCKYDAYRVPQRAAACVQCQAAFSTHQSSAKFCSLACKNQWFAARRPPSPTAYVAHVREWRAHVDALLKSERLSRRQAKKLAALVPRPPRLAVDPARQRASKRASKQRYRARKKAATVEQFTDIDIFERDGWFCQLCMKPTPQSLVGDFKHPDAPTLDHIVSFAKGGTHSRDNAQLLCRHCNSCKSDGHKCGLRSVSGTDDVKWCDLLIVLADACFKGQWQTKESWLINAVTVALDRSGGSHQPR
jgi:5-methylcytosine-specific restriction endonuclease McrA